MLSLKNVRFEILRDPIVRDFSMDLQWLGNQIFKE